MLISLVLRFRSPGQKVPKLFTGHAVHAYLFNLLDALGYEKIDALHEMSEKPFTISPLMKGRKEADRDLYWIRIASFAQDISVLLGRLSERALPPLFIKGVKLFPERVLMDRKQPWVRETSFDDLYNTALVWAKAREEDAIGLRFVTPTTFKLAGSRLNIPLPSPRLVFQSLANRWNAFSPIPLWIDWPDFERRVTVAKCDVRTRLLDFGHFRQVGFVGECWFLIDPQAKLPLRHALYTLAQFAFYAGVGRKTTMGMGMVRPLQGRDVV